MRERLSTGLGTYSSLSIRVNIESRFGRCKHVLITAIRKFHCITQGFGYCPGRNMKWKTLQRVPERLPPLKVCFIAKFRSKPLIRATSLSCQLCITAIIFMPVPQILQNWNNNHQSIAAHYFQD